MVKANTIKNRSNIFIIDWKLKTFKYNCIYLNETKFPIILTIFLRLYNQSK
jgi:hypothetical protein